MVFNVLDERLRKIIKLLQVCSAYLSAPGAKVSIYLGVNTINYKKHKLII